MSRYDPQKIENKWRRQWMEDRLYEVDLQEADRPFYNLMMFPYPSAEGLHVGNMYAFTGVDVYGRFMRMQGKDVFEPIGLDGFGIHSENYAIKVGKHPKQAARETQERFYDQLSRIGNGFAWDHRLETYDPGYYRWTQWIFTEMFKNGLAYRKEADVNWCPSCKTVLADEQVIDGLCERCDSEVARKDLTQWFFRITEYADRLLDNLDELDWSKKVKVAQRNWIGRSEGAEIVWQIDGTEHEITTFTTRPDTIYGATFMVLAPEHPVFNKLELASEVEEYRQEARKKSDQKRKAAEKEKTGVDTGYAAVHPLTGEKLPIWVADFVLMDYGTGAIMGVPAHDERDFAFAQKYELPARMVVKNPAGYLIGYVKREWSDNFDRFIEEVDEIVVRYLTDTEDEITYLIEENDLDRWLEIAGRSVNDASWHDVVGDRYGVVFGDGSRYTVKKYQQDKELFSRLQELEPSIEDYTSLWSMLFGSTRYRPFVCYSADGVLINSNEYNGKTSEEAREALLEHLSKYGTAKSRTTYHLRDWTISRQRYWGPPIPMIYCESCANEGRSWFTEHNDGNGTEGPGEQTGGAGYDQRSGNEDNDGNGSVETRELTAGAGDGQRSGNESSWARGWYPVPEDDLPVELPDLENFKPTGDAVAPLEQLEDWVSVECPGCGGEARRETDVSDTFLDSAWYFLRYPSVDNQEYPWDPKITRKWLPVDTYIGGAEHSGFALLYSPFFSMVFSHWGKRVV